MRLYGSSIVRASHHVNVLLSKPPAGRKFWGNSKHFVKCHFFAFSNEMGFDLCRNRRSERKEPRNFLSKDILVPCITEKVNCFLHFCGKECLFFGLNIIVCRRWGRGLGYGGVASPRLHNYTCDKYCIKLYVMRMSVQMYKFSLLQVGN